MFQPPFCFCHHMLHHSAHYYGSGKYNRKTTSSMTFTFLNAIFAYSFGALDKISAELVVACYTVSLPKLSFLFCFLWSPNGIGQTIIFLPWFLLSFFSSPNLSRRRLDVCHTSTHGVALVRISDAGLKPAARGSLKTQDAKKSPKIAIWAPSHNFDGLYFRN